MPRLPERRRPVDWTVQTWEFGKEDHADPDVLVWISIRKFDALWRRTEEYIADAGGSDDNNPDRYAKAGAWLRLGEPTWMPVVGLDHWGMPTITDGRHRYLWMREHGAWSMPVAVSASEADAVRALCGTRYRTSWYVPPRTRVPTAVALGILGLAAVSLVAVARS
ncbi:hypothetical protein ASF53_11680 [Methylobacterium sp. Leaf123]|nr:hypothetical protein ASF53_11680 [Methylobacterium sp. Leaf123]